MNLSRRSNARRWIPLLIALALLPSCERQSDGVIDPPLSRPFLLAGTVSPDTVRTSALPQTGGIISGTLTVKAMVFLPAGGQPLLSVNAGLINPLTDNQVSSTTLVRDASVAGASADTLYFTGSLKIALPKSTFGRFGVRISLSTGSAPGSNVIERSTFFLRDNHPPVLSNLVIPDTVFVPAADSTIFSANVKATDPDGQSDIAEVFFLNLDATDPTRRFNLYDDGSENSRSGDLIAGDGIYTITLTAPASAKGKVYRFLFQATDSFGDTSASLLHFLTIK